MWILIHSVPFLNKDQEAFKNYYAVASEKIPLSVQSVIETATELVCNDPSHPLREEFLKRKAQGLAAVRDYLTDVLGNPIENEEIRHWGTRKANSRETIAEQSAKNYFEESEEV